MKWDEAGATALVVVVPEAEQLIGALRRAHTPSGRDGMPAHVTLLAPFAGLAERDDDAIRGVCARFHPFGFALRRTGRFDDTGVLYLAPEPAEPFVELIGAFADAFPAHRSSFDPVVPHVTVAAGLEPGRLDEIAGQLKRALPMRACADDVVLFARSDEGRWEEQARFPLTRAAEMKTASPEETEAIAARLAEALRPGDVVTVAGDLGAGKTTFVRGACRALGVEEPITSPTFTIGHRYRGRFDVSHLDLYRFTAVSAAEWGDLEPYFEDAVVFVEWPEAAGDELRYARIRVRLTHAGPTRRVMSVAADDELLERLGRARGAAS